LFYDAATGKVQGINASGRAAAALTIDLLKDQGIFRVCASHFAGIHNSLPETHVHTITVPGAAAGWMDTLRRFGTMHAAQVLQPAIDLAEEGFPIQPVAAYFWAKGAAKLQDSVSHRAYPSVS
jgi:gamma-glutamyltranspeptidase/glutathione hydrolase